jgi:hypothetical protein
MPLSPFTRLATLTLAFALTLASAFRLPLHAAPAAHPAPTSASTPSPTSPAPPVVEPPVDVPALLQRLVTRSHAVADATNLPVCRFKKITLINTLASDGTLKQSKEKLYEVTVLRGMTHNRLLAVNGRDLDSTESEALSAKERRWRETYSASRADPSTGAERMDHVVNEQLVARFDFTAVGRDRIRNRPCTILEFKPKSGELPEERLVDRVLNLFRGRVWIDDAEDEIVRAEATTVGAMRVWGGLLGSLEKFELHLDRERSDIGVWFNRHAEISIRARKLFSSFGMLVREVGSDLRPIEPH